MKNILLIHSSRKVLGGEDKLFTKESLVPSLGLASVAAYCAENGISPRIIDLRLPRYSMRDVLDYIAESKPVLAGITAFTADIVFANETARLIKEKYPGLPVVAGGPHPSLVPGLTLEEFKSFDAVVVGEGERTLVELVETYGRGAAAEPGSVAGIAYRKDGKTVLNPAREVIDDIAALPFPAWHLFDLKSYNNIFPVSASRGCPYRCYFCTPLYLGGRVRTRGHESIFREIRYLVDKFNAARVQFSDAMMGIENEELSLLCDELSASGLSGRVAWDCETRADAVDPALLGKMKKAGCRWVALGVESGNERILREVVCKAETKEQIRKAVAMIKKAGLRVRCFFILGHCTETAATIKDTIRFALELRPQALSFGLMVPNPGSGIRQLAEKGAGGLRIIHSRWQDYQQFDFSCLESKELPLEELKRWQSNAYFTYYLHNPLKALQMLFNGSSYNYSPGGIIKIVKMLLINKFKRQ